MNPVIFKLFGIDIHWYSVLILIGMLIGIFLAMKEAKKQNINKGTIFDMCFYAIIFGIIGARLYYVLFNISYYRYKIFAIWNGGLAIHGGIIVGAIIIYIYSKKKKLDFMRLLDISVPSVILAQAIGRWGNFFNSEAHGIATTYAHLKELKIIPEFVIKGMYIDGIYYLPMFYFECLWCILGFIILIIIRKLKYNKVGTTTSIYLMWYGLGRFFIEAYRTDSLMFGGFKVAQIISIILILTGLVYLVYVYHKGKYENLYNNVTS